MVGCLRVLTQNLQTKYVIIASAARPPMTPPAIAPTLVEPLSLPPVTAPSASIGTQVARRQESQPMGVMNWHTVTPSSHAGHTSSKLSSHFTQLSKSSRLKRLSAPVTVLAAQAHTHVIRVALQEAGCNVAAIAKKPESDNDDCVGPRADRRDRQRVKPGPSARVDQSTQCQERQAPENQAWRWIAD